MTSLALFGNIVTFRATPSRGASYLLAHCRSAPGAGAPPNRHPGDDESFYVLSGRYLFEIDGQPVEAGPGDHVAVPRGAAHEFRNIGEEEAVMLILNWPGLQHEAFFTAIGDPVAEDELAVAPPGPPPPEVLAEMRRVALSCGVEISG